MNPEVLRRLLIAAVLILAVAIPFVFGEFRVGQFTLVLAYAVAVLGLNLLVGFNGQISLGHGAFFALGAYTSALLIEKAGVPYLLSVAGAGALALAVGFLFGVPALRLRGLYLALVTLGLAIAAPQLIKRMEGLTEGTQGLTVDKPAAPDWLPLADDQFVYLLALLVAAVMFLLARNLMRGQLGRAIVAIRDDEVSAGTMGVSPARVKTGTFAISAAYAGVGGALYVSTIGFVAPESFAVALSLGFLAAIVVGGLASIGGAIFGALFIQFVPELATDVNEALTGVIYGTALILVMFLAPGGAAGLGRRMWGKVVRDDGAGGERRGAPAGVPRQIAGKGRA